MNTTDQDTKQHIIDTAKRLINEGEDLTGITVRQIAKQAGVGIGLINYHFKSKDNLLRIAVGDVMANTIRSFTEHEAYSSLTPVSKLKSLIKELYALSGGNERLKRFILTQELLEGNMETPLFLIPLLKDIFGEQKEEMQLRILALQILSPIQVTGLNPQAFHLYSGIDLSNTEQRDQFIDTLIDSVIP